MCRRLVVFASSWAVLFAQAPAAKRPEARSKQQILFTAGGLRDGEPIPKRFACDGAAVSLPLSWSGEPEGTQSFALIMDDPDARDFTHWLLWDIPASVHSVMAGAEPDGASGINDFGKPGYGAPCPPEGSGSHFYTFRFFALDVPSLGIKARSHRDVLDKALKKHILGKVEYRLQYRR
ncbi:MAG TPA: YbhB/YbcL family Raf kinase inhibitor-like protein [Bryobacteraceae bacterium]|jgi:hypothetical protein